MKRPNASAIMAAAAVALGVAGVCAVIGQTELNGNHKPDIWSNIWMIGAVVITACTFLALAIFGAAHFFGDSTIEADASQSEVVEQPPTGQSQTQRKSNVAEFVTLSVVAILVVLFIVVVINSLNSGSSVGTTTDLLPGSLPQKCTRGGPVVFVVSGRQNSPMPSLMDSMAAAAVRAIYEGSTIGRVNLDGRPKLVAAGAFNDFHQNSLAIKQAQKSFAHSLAERISHIRATSAHADVLDALDVAGNAVRAACSHGGKVYLADSGLQETGQVNFRKPGLLDASPTQVAMQLKREHELPYLKGMTVELIGIGDTSPPQQQLDIAQRNNLIAIWSAIIKASGANVGVDRTPRGGPAPTHVPPVLLVPTG
jgi:hypothetical protein